VDTDRLLREVERRLAALPPPDRGEALDAIREEIARERRRSLDPASVEVERLRRTEAETLRDVLEAINRQARLEETIDEVLKQLTRIVTIDTCSLALLDGQGRFRLIAGRGFPPTTRVVGLTFRNVICDVIRESNWPVTITDVREDPRFVQLEGAENIRSWAGIPLQVEGEPIGLLCLDRHRVDPFEPEDLHRARALAFSAAAAIRKAQLLEQVRRYAALMERVVEVDQAVFSSLKPPDLARVILQNASRLGNYPGALFVLPGPGGAHVAVGTGPFANLSGEPAPLDIDIRATERLPAARAAGVLESLGIDLPPQDMYLVPLSTGHAHLATLALLDPDGETQDDRLMEAFASRAAAAYLHALQLAG
jgi:putative methionine-R-sulfoxide reductase with GAF domain